MLHVQCDDCMQAFASVENNMVRGTLYQGGREVIICTPWLKIGLDVGVINADGPFKHIP